MPTLFSLHLSTHKRGFGKPSVKAALAIASPLKCVETGERIAPDRASVREALPHYYRKAFDRASNLWSFPNVGSPYVSLYSSRGRYLITVYAIPYQFNPKGA